MAGSGSGNIYCDNIADQIQSILTDVYLGWYLWGVSLFRELKLIAYMFSE